MILDTGRALVNVEDLFEVENAVNNALGVTDGRLESRLPGESLNLTSQALQVLNHAQRSLLNLQQDLLREAAEERPEAGHNAASLRRESPQATTLAIRYA